MILVTGGTGLIGAHLLYKLVEEGKKVRAIHRESSNLDRVLDVFSYYTDTPHLFFDQIEWAVADITDLPALTRAFDDITQVYHCAAFISFDPADYRELRKINTEGTCNVVNLCTALKVSKLCYVSSIATLGAPKVEGEFIIIFRNKGCP